MRRSRPVSGFAVMLLACAGMVSWVADSGAARADATTCGSLSISTGQVPGGELSDVSFVSADESWAVGVNGSVAHPHQTLIERYDGSAWSAVASPNLTGTNNGLNGVSMIPGGGWAVGYSEPVRTYEPLALRWDGSQWSLASPPTFTNDSLFTGVDTAADGSAWAVGFRTTTGEARRTLVEHASGAKWTQAASPNAAGSTDNTLLGVSGTEATGLWAVGYWLGPAGLRPLMLRYDTTSPSPSWVMVSGVPAVGAVDTVLTGVDVDSATDVWAVGYYSDGSAEHPLALHWDGSTWTNIPIPGEGLLRKVVVAGPGNVWAAGTYYNASEQDYRTLVVHFDGTAWATVTSADAADAHDEIIGFAADPTGSSLTLVGRKGANPLVEQATCPTGPVSLATRAPAPVPPVPVAPGIGPPPSPPAKTPAPTTPIPVTITDDAAAAGIAGPQDWTFSAAVSDFNNDGWPDIFIARHWHPAQLWLNNQDGTFSATDVSYFQSITDRHDCQAADFNQNGRMDLFCSVGADRGTTVKSNALYSQQPNGTFVNDAYPANISDPWGRGRLGAVLDANNDGYPDIFYGAESLRPDGLPSIDRLYMNTGHGSFLDSPSMGLDVNIRSRCAHTVDYNSDGWPDLLLCGDDSLHLFENMKGHGFKDVSRILGPPVDAVDAAMVDVNHDSRPDLITLTRTRLAESLQLSNGTFGPSTTLLKLKAGVSLAVGDVNGDHNPDIYVVGGRIGNTNAPDYLLLGNATGGFTTTPIPETTIGSGDRAYPIDFTHDGLTSFLVLNGAIPFTGPVQLLRPIPSDMSVSQVKEAQIRRLHKHLLEDPSPVTAPRRAGYYSIGDDDCG